jgi:hypothetical protein
MIAELYEALVKAGADDASARNAAVAVADYDRRLADVGQGVQRLETRIETGFAEVDARFAEARTESDARFNQVHLRLAELRAEMDMRFAQLDARFAELRAEMAGVETRITRWFIGILLAQFASVIAIMLRLASA